MARAADKIWYLEVHNGTHSGVYGPVRSVEEAKVVIDVLSQLGMDAHARETIIPSGEDLLPLRELNLAYFRGPLLRPKPEERYDDQDDED